MQPATAKALAEIEIRQYPALAGWTVELSPRATRTLALCIYRRKVIRLSRPFVELNEVPLIVEAVRHEIAHALTPGHRHDAVWKEMAVRVGARPVSCARDAVLPPGRWVAQCPSCKRVYFKYRRPSVLVHWCLACGRGKGQLRFTANLDHPGPAKSGVEGRQV